MSTLLESSIIALSTSVSSVYAITIMLTFSAEILLTSETPLSVAMADSIGFVRAVSTFSGLAPAYVVYKTT